MRIMMVVKYPPIQGGVSRDSYWLARLFAEMGHEVIVVTNAFEVEDEYRLKLESIDLSFLEGNFGNGSIKLVKTYIDPKHSYIPQNNPIVSKIVGLALAEIEKSRPDVIYSHYLEPYGFSAMILSLITGIPYILRHAGSDVGRLMLSEQLKPGYKEVFRHAKVVVSGSRLYGAFISMGVESERIFSQSASYLHPDLFHTAENINHQTNRLTLGIYGKAGKAKGTFAILRAIKHLKDQGEQVILKARWGGKMMNRVSEIIDELGISDRVELLPFIPHWQIPQFIHSCDATLFLEHGFSITQHMPSIPKELLLCGSPFITTKEIAEKKVYRSVLRDGFNCLIVDDPNNMFELASKIMDLKDPQVRQSLSQQAGNTLDAQVIRERAINSADNLLKVTLED